MHLSTLEWAIGGLAGLLVGFSKTGMPGVGILVVPMMAMIFGGRESVGALLPMLIFADVFAVVWYRRHARWDKLWELYPWVIAGIAVGAALLYVLGEQSGLKDPMNRIIGVLVLAMLALHLLRARWGDRLHPTSRAGVASTGLVAGFSTAVSNAAGPIMAIYWTGSGLPKDQFMGTSAWYFLSLNLLKLPIYLALSWASPKDPLMTLDLFWFNLCVFPLILAGVMTGKWFLPRVSQQSFDWAVLGLAGVAAIQLILK